MKELRSGTLPDALQFDAQADLSVSFGFLHHIPLPQWRAAFLEALIEATKPGGFACISLWRFLTDDGLAAKAKAKGIEIVAFDRGGYLYHGRVAALADAAREGGLKF